MTYEEFLISKIKVAEAKGVDIDASLLHPSTKPHQRDLIVWMLKLGAALCAADCGLGKSHMGIEVLRMLHLIFGGKYLIVTELGAADTFIDPDPEVGEGARLGVKLEYVTSQEQLMKSECYICVTNYERVRMGEFDFGELFGVWLDEGNYIKNMASETTDSLQVQLKKVRFKYIATATPSPNETIELINYAHVLDIADRGGILTRFFQRNSTKAGDLTLHPQHADDFWLWVHSWCTFITRPSDLNYSDDGYDLPELEVNWVEVAINKAIDGGVDRDGQSKMFVDASEDFKAAAKIKRESIDPRLEKTKEILQLLPDDHFLIWHHLEDERKTLKKANLYDYEDIYGSLQ